jgi:apolipoprotein D and lipocalin family protein
MNYLKNLTLTGFVMITLACCAGKSLPPVPRVAQVDLPRYMGDWYVIAAIPTFIEREAFDAIESYRLLDDGSIDTIFTFKKGSFDGPSKKYNPHGFVVKDTGNALWGMQFLWPIKSEFIIAHLDENYSETIIARTARDYVWIMARTPEISASDYQRLTGLVSAMGYDLKELRKVPHSSIKDIPVLIE